MQSTRIYSPNIRDMGVPHLHFKKEAAATTTTKLQTQPIITLTDAKAQTHKKNIYTMQNMLDLKA